MRRVPAGRGRSAISSGIAPVWAIMVVLRAYQAVVMAADPVWSADDFLRAVPPDRPGTPPRTRFAYSNIGYLLARQALEDADQLRPLPPCCAIGWPFRSACPPSALHSPSRILPICLLRQTGYHPGWVAHGCVMGTPTDAVRMLRAILSDPSLAQMQDDRPLSFSDPGRPWTRAGYGLGLMIGDVGSAGRVIGHSGGGPFSANAVYAVPDCPGSPVVACFTPGGNEAPAEHAAVALALRP